MKNLILIAALAAVAPAQIQTFSGANGMGRTSMERVDRDGDGRGIGPPATINTTVAAAIAVGVQTVTPGSMTFALGNVTTAAPQAITAATWTASGGTGFVTLTIGAHNLKAFKPVTVSGLSPAGYNGTFTISQVNATQIFYTLAANPGAYVSGGTVNSPVVGLAAGVNAYTLQRGMTFAGAGIPANTTFVSAAIGDIPMNIIMSANATAAGTVPVTVGIGVGTVLTVGLVQNMERVVVTAVTATTFTATFAIAHPAGTPVFDQGSLGIDADDMDGSVWTTAHVLAKYTTIQNFFQKVGNDLIMENPWGVAATTAAMVAGLTNPTNTFYLDNAGSDSNNCTSIATACKTIVPGLTSHGYAAGNGYLLIARQDWNNNGAPATFFTGGTSSKATVLMSYPGEQAHFSSPSQFIGGNNTSFLWVDNILLTGGAYFSTGTDNTGSPMTSITCHDNLYRHIDARGWFTQLAGLYGFGMYNMVIEDSSWSYNAAVGMQHGVYIGSRNLTSSNVVFRRNLINRNIQNGIHWNGPCTGCIMEQNWAYGQGLAGLDAQNGWNHSTIRGNILASNSKGIVLLTADTGQCPGRTLLVQMTGTLSTGVNTITAISIGTSNMQVTDVITGPGIPAGSAITAILSGNSVRISNNATTTGPVSTLLHHKQYQAPAVVICPVDENFNLIENNTIYNTGSDQDPPVWNPGLILPDAGQNAIQIVNQTVADPTNPAGPQSHAGNLDHFTFRNNILVSYGNNNLSPPIWYRQCCDPNTNSGNDYTDAVLMNWMATAKQESNLFWNSDGHVWTQSTGNVLATTTTRYTCAAAAAVLGLPASGGSFSNCLWGDPKFASADVSFFSAPRRFDFRLLPGSPALRAGSTAATTPYDFAGRAYTEQAPSIGALERNLYQPGFSTLTGAGIAAAAPPTGAPRATLTSAISSSALSYTVDDASNFFPGNLAGVESELVCINAVDIPSKTITVGQHSQCQTIGLTITIVSGGSGYTNGTYEPVLISGSPGTGATARLTVSGGVITAAQVLTIGGGYTQASNKTVTAFNLAALGAGSGANLTYTVNASANGRGWAGSSAVAHSSGVTIYLNTITGGGTQAASPANYYPFPTQVQGMMTDGVGCDGVARDLPGQPKSITIGPCGGHSNYIGNEVYSIFPNRVTPSVSRIIGPSVFAAPGMESVGTWIYPATNIPIGTSSLVAQFKDGAPNPSHIQANIAYDSSRDIMCRFGGSYAGGNGPHGYDTNCLNFQTMKWERYDSSQASPPASTHDVDCRNYGTGFSSCIFGVLGRQVDPIGQASASGFSGLATYDPISKTIWVWWNAGNSSFLTQYYPDLHQHVTRAINLPQQNCCGAGGGSNRVYISNRRWIIAHSFNAVTATLNKIDISGFRSTVPLAPGVEGNATPVVVTPDASCLTPLNTTGPGMNHIPVIDRILLYPANAGGSTYYLMDPANWTCTSVTTTGGPPAPFNPYLSGQMQYLSSLDGVMLVNDIGANVPRFLSLNAPDPGATVLTINQTTLPATTAGASYSQTLTASGGTPGYTWAVTSGALPAGLTLSGAGTITGIPTTSGSSTFTVTVTDSVAATAPQVLTILVNAVPVFTTASPMPGGTTGAAYSQTLANSGGTAPFTWSISAGALPAGFAITAATGVISGTAQTAGVANFTARILDNAGVAATKAFAITIASNLVVTTTSPMTAGTVGAGFSQTLTGSGGFGSDTWAVTAGTLPAGLTLASTGNISGTPTSPGTSNFTVQATDAGANTASKALAITITASNPVISTTSPMAEGAVNAAYSQTLTLTGGTAPFTWTITAGALPAGLSLTGSTGIIAGIPTLAAASNFTVRVTDSLNFSDSRNLSITTIPPGTTIVRGSGALQGRVSIH